MSGRCAYKDRLKYYYFGRQRKRQRTGKILSVQAGNIVIGVPQELIGKTLTYLDAMCVASPEQYKSFADDCSKIITSINAAVKNRSKKEAKPKETKNEGIEGM